MNFQGQTCSRWQQVITVNRALFLIPRLYSSMLIKWHWVTKSKLEAQTFTKAAHHCESHFTDEETDSEMLIVFPMVTQQR